ncbi:MAG: RagB/SusD family nutrient uptake outer membrane protein [Lewinellaceae bacterium]|nr:RagB/SusD family nutrient uptake outer membrane protein [Lewinellaceae bacterium]
MLLIKAEAYARKGEIGKAEEALNSVRQKRYYR